MILIDGKMCGWPHIKADRNIFFDENVSDTKIVNCIIMELHYEYYTFVSLVL